MHLFFCMGGVQYDVLGNTYDIFYGHTDSEMIKHILIFSYSFLREPVLVINLMFC